jgi:hypothetical protein
MRLRKGEALWIRVSFCCLPSGPSTFRSDVSLRKKVSVPKNLSPFDSQVVQQFYLYEKGYGVAEGFSNDAHIVHALEIYTVSLSNRFIQFHAVKLHKKALPLKQSARFSSKSLPSQLDCSS